MNVYFPESLLYRKREQLHNLHYLQVLVLNSKTQEENRPLEP